MGRTKRLKTIFISVLVVVLSGLFSTAFAAISSDELKISPEEVNIGSFFSGDTLKITGNIKSNEDVFIEVKGDDSETSFDLKGRVGPVWMTVGNVKLKNIPELYQLILPQGAEYKSRAEKIGLGIKNLKEKMVTDGTISVPPNIFNMFSELKKNEGLYIESEGSIKYSDETNGIKKFTAICKIPDRIKTGSYDVKAVITSNSGESKIIKTQFSVKEVSFVKLVNGLVFNHSLIYGITAVCIAILAGLFMGFIFKQDGGAH